jgi:hypothetical protein
MKISSPLKDLTGSNKIVRYFALKQVILITFTIEFFCRDFNLFQSRPFLIRIFWYFFISIPFLFVMLDFPRLVITFMKVGTVLHYFLHLIIACFRWVV